MCNKLSQLLEHHCHVEFLICIYWYNTIPWSIINNIIHVCVSVVFVSCRRNGKPVTLTVLNNGCLELK